MLRFLFSEFQAFFMGLMLIALAVGGEVLVNRYYNEPINLEPRLWIIQVGLYGLSIIVICHATYYIAFAYWLKKNIGFSMALALEALFFFGLRQFEPDLRKWTQDWVQSTMEKLKKNELNYTIPDYL